MAWLTAVGILVEGFGLFLAGRALLRIWRDVGDGHSIITGKSKTNAAATTAATVRVRSRAYGRATLVGETTEEAIAEIRTELDAIYRTLDKEANTREDADEALRQDVDELQRAEDERERDQTRDDTRAAAHGLFWAVGGIALQLAGALFGI